MRMLCAKFNHAAYMVDKNNGRVDGSYLLRYSDYMVGHRFHDFQSGNNQVHYKSSTSDRHPVRTLEGKDDEYD